jgi:heme-degrading monooxygenase HmoA
MKAPVSVSIKAFNESVIPAGKQQKGYRSGYLLTERKTGKCVTIAFRDSEKDAIAGEQSGHYQKHVDTGKDRFISPPVRKIYEVVAQD